MIPEKMMPLKACRLGIDTHHEPNIYLRSDSHVCKSEGFEALSRVRINTERHQIIATLNMVTSDIVPEGHIGFSEAAWEMMDMRYDDQVWLSHPKPVQSLSYIRAKVYNQRLDQAQMSAIINDIVEGRYAEVHLAAFITACGDDKLDDEEITYLTRAMIDAGSRIDWNLPLVVDKHCVGGLPGNRTTPVVVPILAAAGLTIPKTSSRAITSPAGTADTMETLTCVSLSLDEMRKVVEKEGGCLAWGGSVRLSPADDLLIQVERALDIDSEGQLIASVLSKKAAAGATHVLIDIPVGPTAKVRSQAAAERLAASFTAVANNLGLKLKIVLTDGNQPVGRGVGPALEAEDILAVLQNRAEAPTDLRKRAALLAGSMLELAGAADEGSGEQQALELLESGAAWEKFQAIARAQGGLKTPPVAPYRYEFLAHQSGKVSGIDNRLLAKIAKLAGAPADPAAGLEMHVKLDQQVQQNQTLLRVHAENAGELNYAVEFLLEHPNVIQIEEAQ